MIITDVARQLIQARGKNWNWSFTAVRRFNYCACAYRIRLKSVIFGASVESVTGTSRLVGIHITLDWTNFVQLRCIILRYTRCATKRFM